MRRIVTAAVIIAALLAALVYVLEQERLGNLAVELAVQRAGQFAAEAADAFDRRDAGQADEVQARLDRFVRRLRPPIEGRIVAAALRARDGAPLARISDAAYPHTPAAVTFLERQPTPGEASWAPQGRPVDIEGIRHFLIQLPVLGADGTWLAGLTAVFAPSATYLQTLRNRLWRTVLAALAIVFVTAALLYPVIVRLMQRITALSGDLLDANLEMLSVLGGAIAKRDADTDAHNYRVTIYSVRLAEALGLSDRDIRSLIKGAFLHDVGKIGIPDSILLKPGKLDDDEFAVMRRHVAHGIDIVRRASWLADAQAVVAYHHEKYDGAGYGAQLKADEIPVTARIFAIADVFDALTSRRPYKEPLDVDEAIDILEQGRGSHFDPQLLDRFAPIAPSLHREFANRDDDHPRTSLRQIVDRYFTQDLEALLR